MIKKNVKNVKINFKKWEKVHDLFTKRHENSTDPLTMKCAYKCTKDEVCDSSQDEI